MTTRRLLALIISRSINHWLVLIAETAISKTEVERKVISFNGDVDKFSNMRLSALILITF